jgi:hypothetical protein
VGNRHLQLQEIQTSQFLLVLLPYQQYVLEAVVVVLVVTAAVDKQTMAAVEVVLLMVHSQ